MGSVFVWNGTSYTTELFADFRRAIGFSDPDYIDLPEQEKEAALKLWKELFDIPKPYQLNILGLRRMLRSWMQLLFLSG